MERVPLCVAGDNRLPILESFFLLQVLVSLCVCVCVKMAVSSSVSKSFIIITITIAIIDHHDWQQK